MPNLVKTLITKNFTANKANANVESLKATNCIQPKQNIELNVERHHKLT